MEFRIGQRVMTATSNPFVADRRGVVADIWERSVGTLYVLDDRGLRLLLHESELVPDDSYPYEELRRLAIGLLQMIDDETWRDSGGDDGQGHYEGLYHRDAIAHRLGVGR